MHVLITGASRGFGRALALAFAARGDTVFALARSSDLLEQLRQEHPAIHPVVCDLSDLPAIQPVIGDLLARADGLDVLVNAAATSAGVGPIWQLSRADWDSVIGVNLLAQIELTRLVAAQMVERRSGLIVSVASMAAAYPLAWLSPYCVSKAALKTYAMCLAGELHPFGVRSNAVGITARTELLEAHIVQKQAGGYYGQRTPMPLSSFPPAEENTAPVLFLASEAGSHITGQYFECHSTSIPTWR